MAMAGGSGFVAAHIIHLLLDHGHSVVTSVRSEEKAQAIRKAFPDAKKEDLDFVIVKDVAIEGAFDDAIKSNPPFETVIHTSSPFHNSIKDVKKDFLDPAIIGTMSLLKAIEKSAPTVKRVVCLLTDPNIHRVSINPYRSSLVPLPPSSTPIKAVAQATPTPRKTGIL